MEFCKKILANDKFIAQTSVLMIIFTISILLFNFSAIIIYRLI